MWLPSTDLMQALDPESQSETAKELAPLKEEALRDGREVAGGQAEFGVEEFGVEALHGAGVEAEGGGAQEEVAEGDGRDEDRQKEQALEVGDNGGDDGDGRRGAEAGGLEGD